MPKRRLSPTDENPAKKQKIETVLADNNNANPPCIVKPHQLISTINNEKDAKEIEKGLDVVLNTLKEHMLNRMTRKNSDTCENNLDMRKRRKPNNYFVNARILLTGDGLSLGFDDTFCSWKSKFANCCSCRGSGYSILICDGKSRFEQCKECEGNGALKIQSGYFAVYPNDTQYSSKDSSVKMEKSFFVHPDGKLKKVHVRFPPGASFADYLIKLADALEIECKNKDTEDDQISLRLPYGEFSCDWKHLSVKEIYDGLSCLRLDEKTFGRPKLCYKKASCRTKEGIKTIENVYCFVIKWKYT